MARVENPFALLIEEESDDVSVLVAAVSSKAAALEKKAAPAPPPPAKLPSKPLPPAEAGMVFPLFSFLFAWL